jgi:hypothetical protein
MSRLSYAKTNAVNPLASSSDYGRDIVAIINDIHEYISSQSSESGRQLVEPLGQPLVARQLAAGASAANTALTTTCRRISIRAAGADIRFAIGSTSQTADANTSHFIADGERLDFSVPATPNISVIRDATTDGVLELTELV